MVMVEKEQQLKMRMEHIRFGKEELERRRKAPVHTNRPCIESTGYIHTQQAEPADYE